MLPMALGNTGSFCSVFVWPVVYTVATHGIEASEYFQNGREKKLHSSHCKEQLTHLSKQMHNKKVYSQ